MKLYVNYNNTTGKIKPMNAVNNGPVYKRTGGQNSGNLDTYTAANIPFARTHDASFCPSYGGEHTVDVHLIFRDFDADPYDPASYDFHLTDEYMDTIKLAGTEPFYRLGSKIEHESKKYGTLPPRDFKKWAVICEHIIAHINEGWADGTNLGVRYWEIWNEPDLSADDSNDKLTWGGTAAEFYDFYAVAAKHLKERFPQLKIGGPALCGYNEQWVRGFLDRVKKDNLPLDFLSWHVYTYDAVWTGTLSRIFRNILDEYGLDNTESILNEWNYVKDWNGEGWVKSIETMIGMKGAAFIAAVMSVCQCAPVDMLMYYDARPCAMNGMFSFYTKKPLCGYYPIKAWGEMLKLGGECETVCDIPDIYAVAASDGDSKMLLVTYYTDSDSALPKTFDIELCGIDDSRELSVCLLDETHRYDEIARICPCEGRITITLEPNTSVIIK